MSYITLGNMRRFLDKLKTYIGNNYLKLTGGTVTGAVRFNATPTIVDNGHTKTIDFQDTSTYGFYNGIGSSGYTPGKVPYLVRVQTSSGMTSRYRILDESNYEQYAPSLDGSGATGTWSINISGNALNDSEGNKIVDTYAKKSDIPTVSNITVDSALSATSTNPVQNKVIKEELDRKFSNTGGFIAGHVRFCSPSGDVGDNPTLGAANEKWPLHFVGTVYFDRTIQANTITVTSTLNIPGGKIWIA